MMPSIDVWVMIDTFQEFGFNLLVYLANLWIVYSNESLTEMILNSLAMEFLMNLDNEFEEMYFKFLPEVAEDIYDNFFDTIEDNKKLKNDNVRVHLIVCVVYFMFHLNFWLFHYYCFQYFVLS